MAIHVTHLTDMSKPVNFRKYLSNEYPELGVSKVNIPALLNNVALAYNDHRDLEQKSVDIYESSANELTARSISWRNVIYVNQKQFWKTLGWSAAAATGVDYSTLWSLAAVLCLLKDFQGIYVHEFSQTEANVLYAIYLTGSPDNPYFTESDVVQTYERLFEPLHIEKLKSVLAFLGDVQVIEDEGSRYAVRQEIRLNRWQFH